MAELQLEAQPNEGSRRFTPLVLLIYDWHVITFSTPFVWRCPTPSVLLPFFIENFSNRHLDIGVGNGYFPTKALDHLQTQLVGTPPRDQQLALVDLSPHSLESAKGRVLSRHPKVDIQCFLADAAEPMPASLPDKQFDSASLYLVLHHMPGPTSRKANAFVVAKRHLSDDGVLFGATVLGKAWEKLARGYRVSADKKLSRLTSFALGFYNKRGIFDNYEEDPLVLENVLKEEFHEVETRIVGMMFLFKARRPRAR